MSFLQKSVGIVQCLPSAHVARAVRYLSSQYLPDQMQFEWKKWELAEQTGQYWALAPGFHPGF